MEQKQQSTENLSFSLDGKEYKYDSLTDDQKSLVHQLDDIQRQLSDLEFKHTQVSVARQSFTDMLSKSLKEESSEEAETKSETKSE